LIPIFRIRRPGELLAVDPHRDGECSASASRCSAILGGVGR
jgi:hypothetical protein